MKQRLLLEAIAAFLILFVQHGVVGLVSAEELAPEQVNAVNQAVDRYLKEKGIQPNEPRTIDFSQVSTWGQEKLAETEPEHETEKTTAFGLIKVRATGTYTRGYQAQLRFFHLLNLNTQERMRIDVQSAAKAFVLYLEPGDYEVIRVQLNEGPFTMESHVNWKFQVHPNGVTYLGTWQFEVESPRTQRKVRVEISSEPSTRDQILDVNRMLREKPLLASLPHPRKNESQLFGVAPAQSRARYFYRR